MAINSSPVLKYFADFIEHETGIIYSEDNAYQLQGRLEEIGKALAIPSVNDLFSKAQKEGIQGHFKQLLLDIATNNETSFFRDPRIFKAFEKNIMADLISRKPAPTILRIWSVASSFGQEAYSLAMTLHQMEEAGLRLPSCEILTTDISSRALDRVKEAKYSQLEVQRGLPATMLVKYFEKLPDDHWQIKPEIKHRVKSAKVNLLKISGVFGKFDVIFCRNVLIYQNDSKKKEIIRELAQYLSPSGYFVLGAAESLIGLSDAFDQVACEGAVVYRKKANLP